MEHISQNLVEVRERYLSTTRSPKTSSEEDNKAQDYRAAIVRRGYAANPDCTACNGIGFVHPLDETGGVNYKGTVPCDAPGCLVESKLSYMGSDTYVQRSSGKIKPQTFENFDQVEGTKKAFEAFYLVAYSHKPPFLLCYGDVGNGKTHLARATTKVLNFKGVETRFITMSGLLDMLHSSIPDDNTVVMVNGLTRQKALIIDDWGVDYGTDWEMSKIEDIVDKRYEAELITVITSNKDLMQLEKLSPRIISRFNDSVLSAKVLNEAPDYRPRRKKRAADKG